MQIQKYHFFRVIDYINVGAHIVQNITVRTCSVSVLLYAIKFIELTSYDGSKVL